MPKTSIYPPNTSTPEEAGRRIEVGWRSGSDVQIATTTVDADSVWDGQWVDLDRRGINNLIRVLREARDKAYGRDQ